LILGRDGRRGLMSPNALDYTGSNIVGVFTVKKKDFIKNNFALYL